MSAVLNACALVGVEDILRGWLRLELKPLIEGIIARLISAVLAIISVVMLIVIEKLGGVLGKQDLKLINLRFISTKFYSVLTFFYLS